MRTGAWATYGGRSPTEGQLTYHVTITCTECKLKTRQSKLDIKDKNLSCPANPRSLRSMVGNQTSECLQEMARITNNQDAKLLNLHTIMFMCRLLCAICHPGMYC